MQRALGMKSLSSFQDKARKYQSFKFKNLPIICIYLLSTFMNLNIRNATPTNAGSYSPHDDFLGVRLANNILEGDWLGTWDNLTLAKPPGYPLYLSIVHFFPIQIVVFNQIIFCGFSLLFSITVTKFLVPSILSGKWLALFIYTLLIFNPYLFGIEMSRIYRTSAHTINVFAFVTFLGLLFINLENLVADRRDFIKQKNRIYLIAGCLGLSYSTLILLRSESYWILLSSIPFLARYAYLLLRTQSRVKKSNQRLSKIILPIITISCLTYFAPIIVLGQLNSAKYGTSQIEDYYSGNFAKAIKAWQRVNVGKDPRPYVIISKAQRAAVYEVSSNARLMSEFLELPPGQGWLVQPCNSPIKLCDNAGGWVTWQIRDAALSTGKIHSALDFQEFFRSIAVDIESACANGKFTCTKSGLGVGTKSIGELPIDLVWGYAFQNLQDSIPKNFVPTGEIASPDSFGASAEVVNLYHTVAKYKVQNTTPKDAAMKSQTLVNLQHVFFPVQQILLCFATVGFIFGYWNSKKRFIFSMLGFILIAMIANAVGVAITQVSFGWRAGTGVYLLPINALFQIYIVIGLLSLVSTLYGLRRPSHK